MSQITTHLWYDKEAREAAELYTSIFPNSKIKFSSTLENTPSGKVDILTIELMGQEFSMISAGPLFKFNPSISLHVACRSKELVDTLWSKLSPGGQVMMELGTYPFSERYGWLQDKFGLSWQFMYVGDQLPAEKITPVLMFVGANCGKAEEAITFYTSVFKDSQTFNIMRHPATDAPEREGTIKYASFQLAGKEFGIMDSARDHKFQFNEAISFMVHCENQEEIDYYWQQLSAVAEAEQCGWLKDKYGLSWQIVPTMMNEMMQSEDKDKVKRVTEAFLKMKKFNLKELQDAYEGK